MPRRVGESWDSSDLLQDPLGLAPPPGEVFDASFREQAQFSVGRSLMERAALEAGMGSGRQIPVEEANQRYGLKLKPTLTGTVSEELAQYLYLKQVQSVMDQAALQQGSPGIGTTLGAGVLSSLTDPVEFGAAVFLPITRLTESAALSMKANRFIRPSVAERFLARNPSKALLKNPFLVGAVEGTGGTALVSPLIVTNSEALGRDYQWDDALLDITVSGLAGGTINAAPHWLAGLLGKHRAAPGPLMGGLDVDPVRATALGEIQFANGHGVDAGASVEVQKVLSELDEGAAEIEHIILRTTSADSLPSTGTLQPDELQPAPPGSAQLPSHLRRSAPRYGQAVLQFESDLDKALYIIGNQKKPSKAHDEFVAWAAKVTGKSEEEVAAMALDVRSQVIAQAKTGRTTISSIAEQASQAPAPKTNIQFRNPLPQSTPITSGFGKRQAPKKGASNYHKGMDLGGKAGDPVATAAPGKVVFAGTQRGYGKMVIVEHIGSDGSPLYTVYAHLDKIAVNVNDRIQEGRVIGKVGSTGNVTGPHLHFEVRSTKTGGQMDPVPFLKGERHVQATTKGAESGPVTVRAEGGQATEQVAPDVAVRGEEAASPARPEPVHVDPQTPAAQRHMTALERRLMPYLADQETANRIIREHLEAINQARAKLAELLALPKEQFIGALDDANLAQAELFRMIRELNELLPDYAQRLTTDLDTSKRAGREGILTGKAMQRLGREIERLNNFAVKEMDEAGRLEFLHAENKRLTEELHKAMGVLQRSSTDATISKWQQIIEDLTPQVDQVRRLIQAHGDLVDNAEMPLGQYLASLGDEAPSGLLDLVKENPGLSQSMLYQVRRQIFSNIQRRMKETRDYVSSLGRSAPPRFPENNAILREIKAYLDDGGPTDPEQIREVAMEALDEQIQEARALGIFTEEQEAWFEAMEMEFKDQLEKVDSLKAGTLQAQFCALNGVTEDEE